MPLETNLETPAETRSQDSAPATSTPSTPVFDAQDQHTWTAEQRAEWNRTGDIPKAPKKQDSAPAKKNAASDSAPKPDDTADDQDSAPGSTQKPQFKPKTKDDTERRIKELLARAETAERELAAARQTKPESRDSKPAPQPAPEAFKALVDKEYFAKNPKATYEDFIRAAARHEAEYAADQKVATAIANERQRLAHEAATKELTVKVNEGKERYPDFETKFWPTLNSITQDAQIPVVIKAVLNDSPIVVDLTYTLGSDPAEMTKFVALCKSDPGAALRKLVLTESLVKEQLNGKKAEAKPAAAAAGDDEAQAAKPEASASPKPRAPKPPTEVGGRGETAEDALKVAAGANDFRKFDQEQTRRMQARLHGR